MPRQKENLKLYRALGIFLLMNGLKATEIAKYDKSMKGLYLLLQHTIACGNISSILKYRRKRKKGVYHADRI